MPRQRDGDSFSRNIRRLSDVEQIVVDVEPTASSTERADDAPAENFDEAENEGQPME